MTRLFAYCLIMVSLLVVSSNASALSSNDLLRLREAGIGPKTLELIIREKVVETCAFSVDELIQLKRAGLGDEALSRVIEQGSFMRDRDPVVYGESTKTLRHLGVNDILKLKEAGVSDETIQTVIQNTGKEATDQDRERAWRMLENMGIILDDRRPRGAP